MKIYLLLLICSPLCFAQYSMKPEFKSSIENLLKGDIQTISVKKLKEQKARFIILDAREEVEFKTSHIIGAKHIGYKNFDMKKTMSSLLRDQTIVVYCSVGYRSENIARKLKEQGFKTLNLFGGIFEWNNQGYDLVNNNGAVTPKIHTYNKNWEKWVEKGEKIQ